MCTVFNYNTVLRCDFLPQKSQQARLSRDLLSMEYPKEWVRYPVHPCNNLIKYYSNNHYFNTALNITSFRFTLVIAICYNLYNY